MGPDARPHRCAVREVRVHSSRREQMLDVTDQVGDAVRESGVMDGICLVYTPHTTCAVTVNEGYDPAVQADALRHLGKLVPREADFEHSEGNSDSHIKAICVGPSVALPVAGSELRLGHWQSIFLCEFDGPRDRQLWVLVK